MKVWTLRVGVAFGGMRPAVGNSRLRGGMSIKTNEWGKPCVKLKKWGQAIRQPMVKSK